MFPLKQRYDYLNTTLEGLRHADIEPGDLPEFLIGLDTEEEDVAVPTGSSGSGGPSGVLPAGPLVPSSPAEPITDDAAAIDALPAPDEHWAFDKRGKRYRCDEYGIKLVPGSTRPEGILPADWKI